jgi:thiol:disulfide interchange protein
MLKRLSLGILLSMTLSAPLQAADSAQSLPAYSTVFDESRDPFRDGAAAIELASQSNRRILIDLGGDWCAWCHKMDAFFDANPDLKQRLHQTFVLLRVNVSDANPNSEFLKSFPKPLGYPHMYVSDKNGSVLWSQDTAEFLKDGQYNREAFMRFFDRWQTQNE